MSNVRFSGVLCLSLLLRLAVLQDGVRARSRTPLPGSRERRAIMDALRPPVMKSFRRMGYSKRVVFEVSHLKVSGG